MSHIAIFEICGRKITKNNEMIAKATTIGQRVAPGKDGDKQA